SVGLRTAGAVMAAPRAPLARRFGASLLLRLDQALGRLEEAGAPRLPVAPPRRRGRGPAPRVRAAFGRAPPRRARHADRRDRAAGATAGDDLEERPPAPRRGRGNTGAGFVSARMRPPPA